MRHGGGFRFLAALVLVGVLAALTAGAYGAGYAAGAGSNATVSPWVYGGFIGFGNVVGLIVTIFVLVMIFRVMTFAFWGHHRGVRRPRVSPRLARLGLAIGPPGRLRRMASPLARAFSRSVSGRPVGRRGGLIAAQFGPRAEVTSLRLRPDSAVRCRRAVG
jgi:hypothetical protein